MSATMFQLTVSLALILNMIDVKEAERRKCTYNVCICIIVVVFIVGTVVEIRLDEL